MSNAGQVPEQLARCNGRVLDGERRQVLLHRRVEIERAALVQAGRRGGGQQLRKTTDSKTRLGRGIPQRPGENLFATTANGGGNARRLLRRGQRFKRDGGL